MPNARMSDRAPFLGEVDVLTAGAPGPRRIWGSDVSETGMFLQTTHPFRVGDRVSLRFDVDEEEIHVRAADVVWVRPFEPATMSGRMPGAGLRFLVLEPADRAKLRQFIRPRMAAATAFAAAGEQADIAFEELMSTPLAFVSPPPRPDTTPPFFDDEHDTLRPTAALADCTDEGASSGGDSRTSVAPGSAASRLSPDDGAVARATSFGPRPVTIAPRAGLGASIGAGEGPAEGTTLTTLGLGLNLAFDDSGPLGSLPNPSEVHDTLPPTSPSLLGDTPFDALLREECATDPMRGAHELQQEVENGHLAIHAMRDVGLGTRVTSASAAAPWAIPAAIGLLCAGVVVGLVGGDDLPERSPAPTVATPARELQALRTTTDAPSARAAPVEDEATAGQVPDVGDVPPRPEEEHPTSGATSDVSPRDARSTPGGPPPAALAAVASPPSGRTLRAAQGVAAEGSPSSSSSAVLASTVKPTPDRLPSAGPRTFDVAVGDARVVKAFALSGPSRIVVDLRGATLPKPPRELDGRVAKVRFGTPTPGTQRVVLELRDDKAVRDVDARVRGGTLRVSYR